MSIKVKTAEYSAKQKEGVKLRFMLIGTVYRTLKKCNPNEDITMDLLSHMHQQLTHMTYIEVFSRVLDSMQRLKIFDDVKLSLMLSLDHTINDCLQQGEYINNLLEHIDPEYKNLVAKQMAEAKK